MILTLIKEGRGLPNKIKIIILSIAILAIILLIANLVWGKTMRMSKANQLFSKSQTDKAKAIYEDLAVDSPKSPYILHNIGLSYLKLGENDRAVEYFKNSLKEFESIKLNPVRKKDALSLDYYHLGSAQFQSAAKNSQDHSSGQGQPGGANLYQEALDNFQKAIENNPKDMDAKYNYELTKLRLKSEQGQQSQDKKQNQDQKENQNQQEKQANKGEDKNQNKTENKNANQDKANPKPTQGKDQMSKEEVEALLKMNENNDQYQTQVIKEKNISPEKDW